MAVQAQIYPDNLGIMPLPNSQPWGFAYNPKHQQQQQQQQQQYGVDSGLERQSQEIDEFINIQSERLKMVLEEQRKQGMSALIRRLEAKAGMVVSQKDWEIAQAKRRRLELEELMKRMEMENQSWRILAGERESMIMNLNRNLQQLREKGSGDAEDAESCCNGGEEEGGGRDCRVCGCRKSSVLLLPCRHLCSCTSCEAFIDYCPLCNSPKKASIQALFS